MSLSGATERSEEPMFSSGRLRSSTIMQSDDVVQMFCLNSQYRGPIHQLVSDLEQIKNIKFHLETKIDKLSRETDAFKKKKMYRAVNGDRIDELFAEGIN